MIKFSYQSVILGSCSKIYPMALTGKQKKYLKKYLKKKSLVEIALNLGISDQEIKNHLIKIWGKKKYQRFIASREKTPQFDLKKRISSFDFKKWFNKNLVSLIFLSLLVFIAYFNSLFNEFVSDDVQGILKNAELNKFSYIFNFLPAIFRPFLNFLIVNIFGRNPLFFRLVNIFFHWGVVLALFLLLDWLTGPSVAIFGSAILAVHPLQTEAVTWISGGLYTQYSFFIILALLAYLLSLKEKKFFFLSMVSFLFALLSSEKAMIFPFILLLLMVAFKSLRDLKKLIIPSVFGGFWILLYVSRVPQRMTDLQTAHYQEVDTLNPLIQIPIALTSYLELAFFPKNLTLYHSEMIFSTVEYILRLIVFLAFLGLIFYSYRKNKQLFFWLSFFFISLLPTLTPLGISWIVAERYVYLGVIGIFVGVGLMIKQIMERRKILRLYYPFLALIVFLLLTRTIIRNIDWKNEDNLWLAAAKISPSSPQNHNNLGDYYGRQGDLQRAAEEFKKAIELKPGYADAYHNLANTYGQMGKIDEAIENYQKAIEFNSNLWQSYQNLAAIYFKQENFAKAREELEKAIKINSQNANLHTNLGFVCLLLEEKDRAEIEFKQALELNPNDERAKQGLAKLTTSQQ